jgi:hypothetical protein
VQIGNDRPFDSVLPTEVGGKSNPEVAARAGRLSFERTMPRMIVSDNGTELTSVAVLKWQSIASAQMRKLIEA